MEKIVRTKKYLWPAKYLWLARVSLLAAMLISLLVCALLSFYLFFHYVGFSYTTTNRTWGYAKGERVPTLSPLYDNKSKPVRTETYSFYNFFSNNNYEIRYIVDIYGHWYETGLKAKPIIERHGDEHLFSFTIEGEGLHEVFTSDSINEILHRGREDSIEHGVIKDLRLVKEYTLEPGRYTVTFAPNVAFIEEMIPHHYFIIATRLAPGSNKLVNFLMSVKRTSYFFPILSIIWVGTFISLAVFIFSTVLFIRSFKHE